MTQQCDLLFISPHLDDAVLSCALKILKERRAGTTVGVATICTKGLPLPDALDLYGGRRSEDDAALSILDVREKIQLGFADAPFRNLFYHNFQRVIIEEHSRDQAYAKTLAARVLKLCQDVKPKTVYLPLAVGTHIDHRHTHRLWCTLADQFEVVFYEDRPYSFLPYNLPLRMIEIGASLDVSEVTEQMAPAARDRGLESFASGLKGVAMYKNVLTSKRQKFRYILSTTRKLKSAPPNEALKLQASIVTTSDDQDLKKITAAVGAYKSQINMLFNNMDTFALESASYNRTLEASALYCERYWTLVR